MRKIYIPHLEKFRIIEKRIFLFTSCVMWKK